MPWPYFHAQPLLWPLYFSPKMPGQPKRENLLTKPWVVEYGDIQIVHRIKHGTVFSDTWNEKDKITRNYIESYQGTAMKSQ